VLLSAALPLRSAEADQEELKDAERVLNEAKIATDGPSLLAYIKKRTVPETDRDKLRTLVQKLGDDEFQVRKKAFADLQAAGQAAEAVLREALQSDDPEIATSATTLLEKLASGSSSAIMAAAARVLADRKPAGAVAVLLAYLPLAANDDAVQEAFRNTLVAVGVKGGKADDALVAAAKDKHAVRRAVAAFVLGKAGAEALATVSKLLKDTDDKVRYQAAAALIQARDKAAADTLIAILTGRDKDLAWQAQDLLVRIASTAGEKSPPTLDGDSAENRAKGKEEWVKWWKANSARVNLAKINDEKPYRNLTLICEYSGSGVNGQGRIWLCNKQGKVQRELNTGLGSPLDARLLPNGNVLVGEYAGGRVTERDWKGKIVWEMPNLGNVCSCQRLANGNTLIATQAQLIEVNRKKEKVFSINVQTYYARKLRNNHIVYTTANQVVELDANRKEVKRLNINGANWGSVEKLANGRYLVAVYGQGRVVEIDKDGKELWSVAIASPTLATRLRNGNTLVASTATNTVVEFDKKGKQVWSQRTQGQPWRGRRY
jgi:HEAT repeat protein